MKIVEKKFNSQLYTPVVSWTPSCSCTPPAPPVHMVDAPGSSGHLQAGGFQVTPTAPPPDFIKNEGLDEAVLNEILFK